VIIRNGDEIKPDMEQTIKQAGIRENDILRLTYDMKIIYSRSAMKLAGPTIEMETLLISDKYIDKEMIPSLVKGKKYENHLILDYIDSHLKRLMEDKKQ
jgi:hypothetical protein